MRALDFAAAYDAWLRRSAPSVTEPVEPVASDYGVPEELAEPLRRKVRKIWLAGVVEQSRFLECRQKTV